MINYLICALHNLTRKKTRSILTILGIAIGVTSVIVIGAIGESGESAFNDELNSLGINGINIQTKNSEQNSPSLLYENDVQACLDVNGVESAMPIIMQTGTAVIRNVEKNVLAWGIDSDAGNIISLNVIHGKMFTPSDINSHAKVCLVDDSYAKAIYKRANITGKTLNVNMGADGQDLQIKGIVSSGSSILNNLVGNYIPSFIYVPYTTLEDIKGIYGYDEIAVKTVSNNNMDLIGNRIIQKLTENNNGKNYIANNMYRQKQKLTNLLNIVTLIITAVGAISMVVAGLGIMTVMIVSVNERTREIGIKKAIGAKKSMILLEFLFEAVALSLFGVLLGIIFGVGISFIASSILHFNFIIKMNSILLSTGFAMIIGILFGVYPALKASQLNPVDALRQE